MGDAIKRLRNGDDASREEILLEVDHMLEEYLNRGRVRWSESRAGFFLGLVVWGAVFLVGEFFLHGWLP